MKYSVGKIILLFPFYLRVSNNHLFLYKQRSQKMIALIVDLLDRFVVNMVTVQNDVSIRKIVQLTEKKMV